MGCQIFSAGVAVITQGPIVALIVQLLKSKVPFVRERPQAAAAILNALASVLAGVSLCGADLGSIFQAFLAGFAGSVASYEVAKGLAKDGGDAQGSAPSDNPSDRIRLR